MKVCVYIIAVLSVGVNKKNPPNVAGIKGLKLSPEENECLVYTTKNSIINNLSV
jgi:hypothetical protein